MGHPDELFEKTPGDSGRCSICREIPRDCSILPCGHSFCHDCIAELISTAVEPPSCPQCRHLVTRSDIFKNHLCREIIDAMPVKCIPESPTSTGEGTECQWKGKLSQWAPHCNKDCTHRFNKCPLQDCGAFLRRGDEKARVEHLKNRHLLLYIHQSNPNEGIKAVKVSGAGCSYVNGFYYEDIESGSDVFVRFARYQHVSIKCFLLKNQEKQKWYIGICPLSVTARAYLEDAPNKYPFLYENSTRPFSHITGRWKVCSSEHSPAPRSTVLEDKWKPPTPRAETPQTERQPTETQPTETSQFLSALFASSDDSDF
mmetsp:Transcript_13919/g.28771  ORF Transcript_13919/g.28771 Transcript_13919/m.28771 type:complete len:314 (-) Transcript_13919:87-1028(-)